MALRASDQNVDLSSLDGNPRSKKKTVEQTYTKLSQLEHILLRPDTYIGSAERATQNVWVWDDESSRMVNREITFPPGLYKIFDEILVNAADHKQRDPSMNSIKVDIDEENQMISVWNNGAGIPVQMHKKENVHVPELIFGHLLTSSNYNDNEKKVVGGRNGFGAKLANIFSTEFIVETSDTESGKKYRQVFRDNMSVREKPTIKAITKKESYTKISFTPDLSRFGLTYLDNDIVALLKKRVYDIAGVNPALKVFLNGQKLPIKSFKDYVNLFMAPGSNAPVLHERLSDRWEVVITSSDGQLNQVSFVNSIWTIRGGTHVGHVADNIVAKVTDHIAKKNKGMKVKPFQIKSHLSLFINCLIENPSFDSQTKETLTTKPSKFGSKWNLSDELAKKVMKSEIIDNILAFARFKQDKELAKTDGGKKTRISGISSFDDANKAGGREASKCTLILTEGESAKSLAVSGLSVVGRDYYGVFPLRGKLLNVRDAKHKQIMDNAEINNIKKILGLQHNKKYCAESVKSLRYGHVLIMADQDFDGSHIKGLVINFFDHFWPSLLKIDGFMQEFITPIIKVSKSNHSRVFYTMPQYQRWTETTEGQTSGWTAKYYKGLGGSTAADAKKYFSNLPTHLHEFLPAEEDDKEMIQLAFSKQRVADRKNWLSDYQPGTFFDFENDDLNYSNFVNKELVLFSVADNVRSIPNIIDGFKPSQRKVLFSCFKRKLMKTEIKVGQLSGYIQEHALYHHGDASLQATIIGLAQNFVGSNNINFLVPEGQFGTRLQGGKDAAAARYIFTKLSPITRAIFPEVDDPLLSCLKEEGKDIEPEWYCPVIPTVLVNGSDGIGTGWSSFVPCYNPRDLIANIRRYLNQEEMRPMSPWYRGFRGSIVPVENAKSYDVYGVLQKGNDSCSFVIDELPLRTWTTPYKEFLESNLIGHSDNKQPFIKDLLDNSTENKVKFTFTTTPELEHGLTDSSVYKRLKLSGTLSTANMVLFDSKGAIKKYDGPEDIIKEFCETRYELYVKRREYLLDKLEQELTVLSNKERFILMVVNGELKVAKRKKSELLLELKRLGFDPVTKSKKKIRSVSEQDGNEEENEEESGSDYDYLLSMAIWSLTAERIPKLIAQRELKAEERNEMKGTTPKELWERDLLNLEEALRQDESEAKAMAADLAKVAKAAKASQRKGASKSKRGKAIKALVFAESDDESLETIEPPGARIIAPKKTRTKKAPEEVKVKKETKPLAKGTKTGARKVNPIISDEDLSDMDDVAGDDLDAFSVHSEGDEEDDDDMIDTLDVSENTKKRATTTSRSRRQATAKPADSLPVTTIEDELDDLEIQPVVTKPKTKRASRSTKAITSKHSFRVMESDDDDETPNASDRSNRPSLEAAETNLEVLESNTGDSSDDELELSLSQRLAQRLTVSKAASSKASAASRSSKPAASGTTRQKKTTTQTKKVAPKRQRAAKPSKRESDEVLIISPSPSPLSKKTRVKSPPKPKGRKKAVVKEDTDEEVEQVEPVVASRPRRARATARRIVIDESDSDAQDDSDFNDNDDDSDFE